MFEVSYLGFNYVRLIAPEPDRAALDEMKNKFSQVQMYSYKKVDLDGFEVVEKKTPIIDLTKDQQEIFSSFNSTTRNEINRTKRDQHLRFVSEDDNWRAAYRLHRDFDLERGWMPSPKAEMKKSLIFTAYYDDQLISAISCFSHGTVMRIWKIFSLRLTNTINDLNRNTIGWATRRLVWEICLYGQQHGCESLDLGGIDLVSKEKQGITRFKQSFGGDTIDVYIYTHSTRSFRTLKEILRYAKIDIF